MRLLTASVLVSDAILADSHLYDDRYRRTARTTWEKRDRRYRSGWRRIAMPPLWVKLHAERYPVVSA